MIFMSVTGAGGAASGEQHSDPHESSEASRPRRTVRERFAGTNPSASRQLDTGPLAKRQRLPDHSFRLAKSGDDITDIGLSLLRVDFKLISVDDV